MARSPRRARTEKAPRNVATRLRFERLLSELCLGFVRIHRERIDHQIVLALRRVGEELAFDRVSLGEFTDGGSRARVTHSWTRDGVPPLVRLFDTEQFPWVCGRLHAGHSVFFSRPEELPAEAASDRRRLLELGRRSMALVPFVVGETFEGVLAASVLRGERRWPTGLMERLGRLAGVFAIVLVRRRAELAIEESEARFQLMADAAPIMLWVAGRDGRCTFFNRAWLDFTGRSLEEEDAGDGWMSDIHPDDRLTCARRYHGALKTRTAFSLEYRRRRFDGLYRWMLDQGVPRFGSDGAFNGCIGSAVDITDVKTAQEVLAETAALRSAIFASLDGEVAALDRDGVIVAVNGAWTRFAQENGADPASVGVGANYFEVCRRAADAGDFDATRALEAIASVQDGGAPRASLEYASVGPDRPRWFAMTVVPIDRPHGGLVISHTDVTRRWRAEKEVEREREELAHTQRVAVLGGFAASLAHEINQPLAAILSNAQAAGRLLEAASGLGGKLPGALHDIAQDAKRAALVVARLRTLVRKEHGDRQAVDVNEMIREVVALLGASLDRSHVALDLHLVAGLPRVRGDVVQLQQVLLNVVVNACEAMDAFDPGARELRIETARRGDRAISIEVRDSGVGIATQDLERIFDRFVTNKPEGLGMGLSISRSIIEAHGGRIWATRNEGRGLIMHIELPCLPS
jgi:PAS domain S-box-containing protein